MELRKAFYLAEKIISKKSFSYRPSTGCLILKRAKVNSSECRRTNNCVEIWCLVALGGVDI